MKRVVKWLHKNTCRLQTQHQNTLWMNNRKSTSLLFACFKSWKVRFLFQPANNHHRTCVGLNVKWVPDLCSLVGYAENFELFSSPTPYSKKNKRLQMFTCRAMVSSSLAFLTALSSSCLSRLCVGDELAEAEILRSPSAETLLLPVVFLWNGET